MKILVYLLLVLTLACKNGANSKMALKTTNMAVKQDHIDLCSVPNQWIGSFDGSFLRLEGESADPRGWATVELDISKKTATFYLFSYAEEINHELDIVEVKDNSITFKVSNSDLDNKILLRKKNGQYEMESDLINSLVKKEQLIIMNLNVQE
ncbi:hypothetical protein [Labilibaculum antarcticum]|uniref:Uncharacterized protein n=1 Tax=Labilibaculum antarcticum TaxID=1717717 RepID=A0A1Y1CEL2_9BACT|nr:hypothetical protein [Labilibaculum antarcticum]BAX78765.1 hypothetical protein ALGA_0370 [Labilibaculum antarcticum]